MLSRLSFSVDTSQPCSMRLTLETVPFAGAPGFQFSAVGTGEMSFEGAAPGGQDRFAPVAAARDACVAEVWGPLPGHPEPQLRSPAGCLPLGPRSSVTPGLAHGDGQFCQSAAAANDLKAQGRNGLELIQLLVRAGDAPQVPAPRVSQPPQPMTRTTEPPRELQVGAPAQLDITKKVKRIRTSAESASHAESYPTSPTLSLPESLDGWLPSAGEHNSRPRVSESPRLFRRDNDGRLWLVDSDGSHKAKQFASQRGMPASGSPNVGTVSEAASVVRGEWASLTTTSLLQQAMVAPSMAIMGQNETWDAESVPNPSHEAPGLKCLPANGAAEGARGDEAPAKEAQCPREKKIAKRKRAVVVGGE